MELQPTISISIRVELTYQHDPRKQRKQADITCRSERPTHLIGISKEHYSLIGSDLVWSDSIQARPIWSEEKVVHKEIWRFEWRDRCALRVRIVSEEWIGSSIDWTWEGRQMNGWISNMNFGTGYVIESFTRTPSND